MVVEVRRDDWGVDWEVWLEPERGDKHVGICCGVGSTRAKAIESALCEMAVVIERTRFELLAVGEKDAER